MPILTFSEYQSMVEKFPLIDRKVAAEVLWTFDQDTRFGRVPTETMRMAIELAGAMNPDRLRCLASHGKWAGTAVAQAVLCYQEEPHGLLFLREKAAAQ